MRISDWSSDVCSSDLLLAVLRGLSLRRCAAWTGLARQTVRRWQAWLAGRHEVFAFHLRSRFGELGRAGELAEFRSEEHTSELQSLMRISYAVFCLKKKNNNNMHNYRTTKPNTESQQQHNLKHTIHSQRKQA